MDDLILPRIGVLRHDRPLEVVAIAEARVIGHELDRRLGALTLDLRTDGDATGPWQPVAHAGWPTAVDATVDVDELVADDIAPLTALLGRTIDPTAADVRRRMLVHLGGLPIDRFTDTALATATELPLRPTDLWLLVTGAERIEVTDIAVRAVAGVSSEAVTALDERFDAVAGRLRSTAAIGDATDTRLAALASRVGALEFELGEARDDLERERLEALHRLDELLAERRRLVERLERVELDRPRR